MPAATRFRIEVEAGGRRLIRIADDGCGMLRDDALLAFERHATSKLRDVKDLLSIATLGFRGEALPSIASVSRLLLETRSADETTGTRVEIAGGKMLRCDEAALSAGHRDHRSRSVLQRSRAQEVPAVRADRAGAHRLARHALQPGASRTRRFELTERRERAAARHAGGDAARARLSGVRQPDAGRAGGLELRAELSPAALRPALGGDRRIPARRRRAADAAFPTCAASFRGRRCRRAIATRSSSSSTAG